VWSGQARTAEPYRRCRRSPLVVAQRQHAANVDRTGLSFALVDEAPPEAWMPLLGSFSRLGIDEANAKVIGEYFARIDTAATLPGVRELVQTWRHGPPRRALAAAGACAR
jgi:hypothetical protein